MWTPSLTCFVCQSIIHVNSMSYEPRNLETGLATRLDRCVDRTLSRRSYEEAGEATFGAAARSAPPKPAPGEFAPVRPERGAAASAASPPTPPPHEIGGAGRGCSEVEASWHALR